MSLMGTMGGRQRERCCMWQPSSLAPVQATDPTQPVKDVTVTAVAPSLASASASTETPVFVEVLAAVGIPVSAEAGPLGVGRSGEAGWREATGKKKRKKKGGKKPQEAVVLADLKFELSAISI